MSEKRLVYCQHMVYLCESQAKEWSRISESLSHILLRARSSRATSSSSETAEPEAAPRLHREGARAEGAQERPEQPPAANMNHQARMQLRIAHAIRGLVLIFALGLPRVLYYIYGGYCVLVLSGAVERMQSAEFRQLFTGSRPALELQLSRLRSRKECLERLAAAASRGEPVDEEQSVKDREFLEQFFPRKAWIHRFLYQSVFMFVYTLLPSCHPHADFLT